MRSSISSSEGGIAAARPASAERETAADRPGVAQPVPVRPVPVQPWGRIAAGALVLALALLAAWEWRMQAIGLARGDLDDSISYWAEQRRRVDAGGVAVAIVGDSRILFDTDLDRFEALTGTRPLQLALPGTNGRPFLEELAADPDFTGLAIVGIADLSYFRDAIGLMAGALERYRFESPSQRSGHVLHQWLGRRLAFLDDQYRLSVLVQRLDRGWRAGVKGPYADVWKISTTGEDRQTAMWWRIERPGDLQTHALLRWDGFRGAPIPPDAIARAVEGTRDAVAKIRARGGEVVFVRPPSAPALRINEIARLPRARGWDALLATADVRGVHFDDHPSMQGLVLPELSHLSAACATVYTDAYVRALAVATPRVRLRPDAPPPLQPEDCR